MPPKRVSKQPVRDRKQPVPGTWPNFAGRYLVQPTGIDVPLISGAANAAYFRRKTDAELLASFDTNGDGTPEVANLLFFSQTFALNELGQTDTRLSATAFSSTSRRAAGPTTPRPPSGRDWAVRAGSQILATARWKSTCPAKARVLRLSVIKDGAAMKKFRSDGRRGGGRVCVLLFQGGPAALSQSCIQYTGSFSENFSTVNNIDVPTVRSNIGVRTPLREQQVTLNKLGGNSPSRTRSKRPAGSTP